MLYGLETLKDGTLKPVARCGHYGDRPEIVWALLDAASRLHDLECWAKGIVNSSKTFLYILVLMDTPLGKADGPAKPVFGMQIREARNDFSRDKPIEFCLPRECAERMCRLRQKNFAALKMICPCILITNGIKPDLLTLKQLVFSCKYDRCHSEKEYKSPVTLDSSVLGGYKKI